MCALVLAAGLIFAMAACTDKENPRGGNRVAWDGPAYVHPPDPNPVGAAEFDGWEHCGWEDIRFLGVPPEVVPGHDGRQRYQFVRTSAAELPWTVGDFEASAALPADATKSPYSQDDRELWFSAADAGRYAYIVDGESVERWPRFDGGCE